jgi:hypothetical protein
MRNLEANYRDQSDLAAANGSASFSSDAIGPAAHDGGAGHHRGHNLIRFADTRGCRKCAKPRGSWSRTPRRPAVAQAHLNPHSPDSVIFGRAKGAIQGDSGDVGIVRMSDVTARLFPVIWGMPAEPSDEGSQERDIKAIVLSQNSVLHLLQGYA